MILADRVVAAVVNEAHLGRVDVDASCLVEIYHNRVVDVKKGDAY